MHKPDLTNYQQLVDTPYILSIVLKITAVSGILLAILWSKDGIGLGAKANFALAGISLFLLWINHLGHHRVAGLIFWIALSAITTYLLIIGDGFYNAPAMVYPLLIIFSGLVFGQRSVPYATSIMTLLTLLLFILEKRGLILPFNGTITLWTGDLIIAILLMIATGAVLSILMKIIEHNLQKIVNSEQDLREIYNQTLIGWAKALELRGREPKGHYQRVMDLVNQFSDTLELDEDTREELRRGALLHDIGKMGIPDAVLLKPGSLSDEEFEIIKQHTRMAEHVLNNDPYLKETLNIALYHHEHWNGEGYPEGLKADQIPYSARIFSLVDSWDAMTSDQIYRAAWPREKVIEYIRQQAGAEFDKNLAMVFIRVMENET